MPEGKGILCRCAEADWGTTASNAFNCKCEINDKPGHKEQEIDVAVVRIETALYGKGV